MAPLPFQRNIDSCHPEEPRLLRKRLPLVAANSKRSTAPGTNIIRFHSRRIICWWTACTRASYRKNCGTPHRSSCWRSPKRYEPVNRSKTEQAHLLSALVKCPICGAGMYSNKCTKRKKDGTPYKSFSYYSCKHRKMQRGQNAISTSKFRKKFWTTPWWRLSSNWSAIQSLPP